MAALTGMGSTTQCMFVLKLSKASTLAPVWMYLPLARR